MLLLTVPPLPTCRVSVNEHKRARDNSGRVTTMAVCGRGCGWTSMGRGQRLNYNAQVFGVQN
jgi:hypothetical protein